MQKIAYLAALTVLACGAAYAGYVFESMDLDHSGSLSQEEASAMPGLAQNWKDLDTNTDGVLDHEEFLRFDFVSTEAATGPGPMAGPGGTATK